MQLFFALIVVLIGINDRPTIMASWKVKCDSLKHRQNNNTIQITIKNKT